MTRLLMQFCVFGCGYSAIVGVWQARWIIAASAVAGGIVAVLVGLLILRGEGQR